MGQLQRIVTKKDEEIEMLKLKVAQLQEELEMSKKKAMQ